MPIRFDEHQIYDRSPPQTVEDSLRAYVNWAGIHDFEFLNDMEVNSVAINATGWTNHLFTQPVDNDILVEYTVEEAGHAAILGYNENGHYYRAGITANGTCFAQYIGPNGPQTFFQQACDEATFGDVKVAFREQRFSDNEDDVWASVCMWVNDALAFTASLYTQTPLAGVLQCGLSAETSMTFTNIRVPQLTQFTEWSSLDPGETPMGGLQRAMEGRYVKYFVRWNGAFRAWRSRAQGVKRSFTKGEVYNYQRTFDRRALFSHVRMMGAYEWAEYHDEALSSRYGHRFTEVTNPYLMNENACHYEAEQEVRRMKEAATTHTYQIVARPLLEPEDRITGHVGDGIITNTSLRFAPGVIQQDLVCREYSYEE